MSNKSGEHQGPLLVTDSSYGRSGAEGSRASISTSSIRGLEGRQSKCDQAVTMAPGYPPNLVKEKEGGRTGTRCQDVVDSGNLSMLSSIDPNRCVLAKPIIQSWPALNKSILPPPKKRHHSMNPHPVQSSRVIYMECKENKSDRGGSLTSRISSLSPGTKRKMLGYAADGSIPPLPPRQKRVKRVSKQSSGDAKQCTKYTRMVEPSGLLGDLKPGIMRQQMRTRRQIHALLGAVVGESPRIDSHIPCLPAIEGISFETDTIQNSPAQIENQIVDCSGSQSQNTQEAGRPCKEKTVHDKLDVRSDATKNSDILQIEGKRRHVEVLTGSCDTGTHACSVLVNTLERASGFVRFQRNGMHACNQSGLIMPTETVNNKRAGDQIDPICQNRHVQLLVNLKQEPDLASISGMETGIGEMIECKQEVLEEDDCRHPYDPSECGGVGSSKSEDGILPQPEDSKLLVSVAAANVATCWLELLSLDVKGRLAALKSSKQRVGNVIASGELDLDAPLLPCTFGGATSTNCSPSANGADRVPQVESWRKVFESMDRALTLEGNKLENWLQQIHVMQTECQRDMTMPVNVGPSTFSEQISQRPLRSQQQTISVPAASIVSTASFASQLGDILRT